MLKNRLPFKKIINFTGEKLISYKKFEQTPNMTAFSIKYI